ncbi:MAG: lytC [Bacillales bacterium]|nr:lytC [Bacillales bacterium]
MFVLIIIALIRDDVANAASVNRLSGQDRYEVSVSISKSGWSQNSVEVILVNGYAIADALCAGPLAYDYKAPILLTTYNDIPKAVLDEIERLQPTRVTIVGGDASVPHKQISQIKERLPNVVIERISGKNRYEVSANIAQKVGGTEDVFLTSGTEFADALTVSSYASLNKIPIIITRSNFIPEEVSGTLNNYSKVKIVGGTASVSEEIEQILSSGKIVSRISGKDRYEVNTNFINNYYANPNKLFIAYGYAPADALSGAVVSAIQKVPLALTRKDRLPEELKSIIISNNIEQFTILGGEGSVQNNVQTLISNPVTGKVIVIDAGHGGLDNGASGNGIVEKELNLDIALRLKTKITNSLALIKMTRETDDYLQLIDRANIANCINQSAECKKADIFVSIHGNSYTSSTAKGTETYWSNDYESLKSNLLATSIQNRLYVSLGTVNRGVKEYDYSVLRNTTMPSALVELGFLSNPEDAAKLKNTYYRDKATNAIYTGIVDYFKK